MYPIIQKKNVIPSYLGGSGFASAAGDTPPDSSPSTSVGNPPLLSLACPMHKRVYILNSMSQPIAIHNFYTLQRKSKQCCDAALRACRKLVSVSPANTCKDNYCKRSFPGSQPRLNVVVELAASRRCFRAGASHFLQYHVP